MFTTEEAQARAVELGGLHRALGDTVAALDPDSYTATDAADLLVAVVAIERLAGGARLLLSARAAESGKWRATGHRSPEDWLAAQLGTSVADAKGDLDTSGRLGSCPRTRAALARGEVSTKQANDITDAGAVDPDAEKDLLDLAEKGASKKELREESQRRKAAADPDPESTAARIRRNRRVRSGSSATTGWWMRADGPSAEGAGVMAALRREADRIFHDNRRRGIHENPDACLFDALVHLVTGIAPSYSDPAPPGAPTGTGSAPASSGPTRNGTEPTGSTPNPTAPTGDAPNPTHPGTASDPAPAGAADADRRPKAATRAHTADRGSNGGLAQPGAPARATGTRPTADPPAHRPHSTTPAAPAGPEPPEPTPGTGPPTGHPPDPGPSPGGAELRLPGLDPPPPPPTPASNRLPLGSNAKIIVRIDHAALVRGHTLPGETCEVAGVGPVDVDTVRAWMSDAFLAAVLTEGTEIRSVVHLGRKPTVLQRTALQAAGAQCARLGCGRTEGLQIDHRVDWHQTEHTTLDELDWLCRYDHSLKTLYGWALEEGTGPRRLLPPEDPDHPDHPDHDRAGDDLDDADDGADQLEQDHAEPGR